MKLLTAIIALHSCCAWRRERDAVVASAAGTGAVEARASPSDIIAVLEAAEPHYAPEECSAWLAEASSADVDGSGGLSEEEYLAFLKSAVEHPPRAVGSASHFDGLDWAYKVAHKALACRCEDLGGPSDCCTGEGAEVPIDAVLDGVDPIAADVRTEMCNILAAAFEGHSYAADMAVASKERRRAEEGGLMLDIAGALEAAAAAPANSLKNEEQLAETGDLPSEITEDTEVPIGATAATTASASASTTATVNSETTAAPGPPPTWIFSCAAYIPLLTANLSVIGSSLIIYSMLRGGINSPHSIKQLKQPQNRILLAMSIYDVSYSLPKACAFLLYPTGYGVPFALGNLQSCSFQGFCIQLGGHACGANNAL